MRRPRAEIDTPCAPHGCGLGRADRAAWAKLVATVREPLSVALAESQQAFEVVPWLRRSTSAIMIDIALTVACPSRP